MSFIEDLLYPDNASRSGRAIQLHDDCEALTGEMAAQKRNVVLAVEAAAHALSSAVPEGEHLIEQTPFKTDTAAWQLDIPVVVTPLMAAATVPLGQAAQAALLLSGAGLPLVFTHFFGLPAGFPKSRGNAIDVKDGFGLIPAAIDGALTRSQLRTLITQLRQSRALLQQSVISNRNLIESLSNMASSVDHMVESLDQSSLPAQARSASIKVYVEKFVDNSVRSLKQITIDDAIQVLSVLDAQRGAWTAEDFYS